MNKKILAIIPARAGSKRIPGKNIRIFQGKPLIWHAINQARQSGLFDKIIVDTDSEGIRKIALRSGAEVPFLRPAHLAQDGSKIADAIEMLLNKLRSEFNYSPYIFSLLQTTSPLREVEDIKRCYEIISKPGVNSVCTFSETHPRLYNIGPEGKVSLANSRNVGSTNTQDWPKGYIENGALVYMLKTKYFLENRKFVSPETIGVITPRWRSVDLDNTEDWVMAELLYKNRNWIKNKLKSFK